MSRSVKKRGIVKYGRYVLKRQHSRKFRRLHKVRLQKGIIDMLHRYSITNPCNIVDVKSVYRPKDWEESQYLKEYYKTPENYRRYFFKK